MSKRLPLVIVLLVGVSLVFAALIAKELTSVPRVARPRPQPAASVSSSPTAAPPAAPAPAAPANYAVVASRNLFSPTRTEAPVAPVAPTPPPPAPILPKPNLFGVVLQEGTPIAYLEDPLTKRVARYRVGDTVAGGTVQAIGPDTVMLARPEGPVTVRLHDPTRPKPAIPAAPGPTPTPGMPTVAPPQGGATQGGITTPFRRPVPPGVLGRVPPQPANAPSPE
jgi:hypothetical protein